MDPPNGSVQGRVAQSVERLTQEPRVPGSIPGPDLRRAVVSYRRKYMHFLLFNRLGGLSLPSNSVVS